ncbi:MAG: hypothetical protein EOP43_04805 [Sphingobacteriaceae bacterium]|nr:MAG: hypothetical protein EOP43_04805 [Sphingobacteriaceae bacterium]
MKKLIIFVILSGIAFKLKAQQKSTIKPLEKLTVPNAPFLADTGSLVFKYNKDVGVLFQPKPNQQAAASNNLIASLDRMPIVKPVGKWNMPIVHPNGNIIYKMPVKRLPPVIKPDTLVQKTNP